MIRKKINNSIIPLFIFFVGFVCFTNIGRNIVCHPWASIFDETGKITGYGADPGGPVAIGATGKLGVEINFYVQVQTNNKQVINVVIPREDYSRQTPGFIGKSVWVGKTNENFVLGPYYFDEPLINLASK